MGAKPFHFLGKLSLLSSHCSCVFTQVMRLCILSAKRTRSGSWYKDVLTLGIVLSLWKEFRCWNPACDDGAETREFAGSPVNGSRRIACSLEWAFEGARVSARLPWKCFASARWDQVGKYIFFSLDCEPVKVLCRWFTSPECSWPAQDGGWLCTRCMM